MNSKGLKPTILLVVVALVLGLLALVSLSTSGLAQELPLWVEKAPVAPLSTTFTYQGQLKNNGQPVNADCSLAFRLYDAAQDGVQVGSPITRTVAITDGLFTVALDFGADVFTGDARWLGIRVQCPGDAAVIELGRQALTAVPYALYALSAPWSGLRDVPPGFADGVDDVSVVVSGTQVYAGTGLTQLASGDAVTLSLSAPYRLPQTCANGQIAEWNGALWVCGNDDTGAGGAYWSLTGNTGTNPLINFLGTTDAVSLTLGVNGAPALRLEPNATSPNVIGGYGGNVAWAGVYGASIGGGGVGGAVNGVYDLYGTVGGGVGNAAYGEMSTVGGGGHNAAGRHMATVGGGEYNHAEGDYSVVAGGDANHAAFDHSFIGGGLLNYAGGPMSVIGGGESISVTGYAATVAGGAHITVTGAYAAVGGGIGNDAIAEGTTIGGGNGNHASGTDATVSGGNSNAASGFRATIGGGESNLVPAFYGTIAGGYNITVAGGYAAVGGGESNVVTATHGTIAGGYNITVIGDYAAVGGGYNNTASSWYATVGGGGANTASGYDATVGGGAGNTAIAEGTTIGGGDSNTAYDSYATVGGGHNNTASGGDATIAGGYNNIASGIYATVGGGQANTASGLGAVIAGGGSSAMNPNTASGDYSAIGGGSWNTASGQNATIGGGYHNVASGWWVPTVGGGSNNQATEQAATVSGGIGNMASGTGASIGGGSGNTASGVDATIGGGLANIVSGTYATIPGGAFNVAQGNYSFAAGRRARALHQGTFVWADSTDADFDSTGNDQFRVRANGGVRIYTGANSSYFESNGGNHINSTMVLYNIGDGSAAYMVGNGGSPLAEFDQSGAGAVLDLQNAGDVDGNGGGNFITGYSRDDSFDLQFRITSSGQGRSDVGWTTPAEDFAEMLPAVAGLEPGDVLAIGSNGTLVRSTKPYQTSVVGVYSTQPGFIGGHPVEGPITGTIPLAVVGIVPVKVTAENGAILPGDLLVASSTPGYAMKAGPNPPQGAVIGKALEKLDVSQGKGVIKMLATLQ
ncbi:MAG: hypothetical protein JXR84_09360 [Anaerolineae bacterium]|nr:hypothetical protein [Anaerolineae bacterium]